MRFDAVIPGEAQRVRAKRGPMTGSAETRDPRSPVWGKRSVPYYVYILASGRRGTIYIGVTNNLVKRVYEHRTGAVPGFTRKHEIHRLVYYEVHEDIRKAIAQEKRMKRWARAWKVELIEKQNEDWHDLWPTLAAWS